MANRRIQVARVALVGMAVGAIALSLALPLSNRPAIADAGVATTTTTYPEMDVTVAPPPADFQPKVSSEEAIRLAQELHPNIASASAVSVTLAAYTNEQIKLVETGERLVDDVPAWVIDIVDICEVPISQPIWIGDTDAAEGVTPAQDCVKKTRHVVVDATTGQLIEDWS